jgi:Uma2 family endonuclease
VSTFVVESQVVRVPDWVEDLSSFRRWSQSDEFPDDGRIAFLDGGVWVDMSKEQVFTHNQVKGEYNRVLGSLAKDERRGRYFPDGLRLTSIAADFSVVPDGTFVSFESLESGRVQLIEGAQEGYVELEGTPDMTLEIISASSVEKDTEILRDAYWRARIGEYWLADARGERPRFDILRYTQRGYVPTRKQGGWIKSAVFGKSFRLIAGTDALDHPEYTLEIR